MKPLWSDWNCVMEFIEFYKNSDTNEFRIRDNAVDIVHNDYHVATIDIKGGRITDVKDHGLLTTMLYRMCREYSYHRHKEHKQ